MEINGCLVVTQGFNGEWKQVLMRDWATLLAPRARADAAKAEEERAVAQRGSSLSASLMAINGIEERC